MIDPRAALDRVWRSEAGSMLGVLARRLGDLDRAEEALQDAVGEALRRWPSGGVPDRPSGWLVTVAWHRALDRLRRDAAGREKLATLAHTPPAEPAGDDDGRMVLLEEQDRGRWDRTRILAAVARLHRASVLDRPGPYQLQAAIAAQHALAPSYEGTDWAAVRALYDMLSELQPSPVVRLGRAVATRYTHGPTIALAEVDALADRLTGYRLWHATRAELLRALGRVVEAAEATGRALALATNPAERELLARRLAAAD